MNKVKFKLKKAAYAPATIGADGTVTYATPVVINGACALSLDPQGDLITLPADGIDYYVGNENTGYDGELEMALVPEDFRTSCLGETADTNGVVTETNEDESSPFALLFEFAGDSNAIRHVMYLCYATRPKIEGENSKKDPKTESVKIKAMPRQDGKIKAKTGDETDSTAYSGWYTSVYDGPSV